MWIWCMYVYMYVISHQNDYERLFAFHCYVWEVFLTSYVQIKKKLEQNFLVGRDLGNLGILAIS